MIKKISENLILPDNSNEFVFEFINERNVYNSSDVRIGKNCNVNYVFIFDLKSDFKFDRNLFIDSYSKINCFNLFLGSANSGFVFNSHLKDNVVFNSENIFYKKDSFGIDIKDNYLFEDVKSFGRFNVSGLLDNGSNVKYFSDVVIDNKAQMTDSRIDMKLYLLDKKSSGVMLPGLKIDANNVKAGHGASTFSLSKEELFYLNSRGLNGSDIKNLIINSIVKKFISDINNKEIGDLISGLI